MTGSLTRVRNNQVYNSDIYASAKLVAKSVTGGLLSDNFTYTGNMTVGNLTVNGNTTTIDTTNLVVADPLLAINRNQSGAPTYDLGFIMGRGSATNVAMIWEEVNKQFQLQYTSESTASTTYGTINNSGYANLQAYGVLLNNATIGTATLTNSIVANTATSGGTINNTTIGATTPNTGVFTTANINGTLYAATVNAGTIGNSGAAFTGATQTLTGASQAASFTTSGGGQHIGYHTGAIGANGANSGAFTTLSTTGNITAGGQLYITGNIIPSANVTYYLGNATNRFKSLYLSANTMFLGSFSLSDVNGNLTVFDESGTSYYGLQAGYITNTVIGNITPASGTFTSVTAASGGQITGYHTGAIGANSANSAAFTTLTTTGGAAFNSNATLTTDQTTVTLFNLSSTTINLGGAATTVNIGAATGTTNVANNLKAASFTASGGGNIAGYVNGTIGANAANSATFTTANVNGTLYAATVNAGTIGNTGAAFSGATSTLTGTSQAASFIATSGQISGYLTGALGANTPNSVVATSVTTSNGGQITGYHTGAIGANTANSGAFTTVTASGALTAQGTITGAGQVIGYFNGAIGANAANSGAFTTITSTSTIISQGTISAPTINAGTIGNSNAVFNGASINLTGNASVNAISAFQVGNTNTILEGTIGSATPSQPNITSVGTLTSLTTSGTITAQTANVYAANFVANTASYSPVYYYPNGVNILNAIINSAYSNANAAAYLTIYTGNLLAGNITALNSITGYLNGVIGANAANSATFTTTSITSSTNTNGLGTGALVLTQGGASIQQDLYVGGNIYAANIISQTSQTLVVRDPLLYLSANAGSYNYEIGFYSNFTGGNVPQYAHTGLTRNHTNNQWYLFSNIPEPSGGTIDLANANIVYDTIRLGAALIQNTTTASSTTSGALQVAGGAGIAGALYAGSIQNTPIGSTTPSSGVFTGVTSTGQVTGYLTGAIGANTANSGTFTTANVNGTLYAATLNAGTIGNAGAAFSGATSTLSGASQAASFTTSNGGQISGYHTGAIGANTANSGTFTTVTTSGIITAQGTITGAGQVIGYFNGAIGANAANSGVFTTLTASGTITGGGQVVGYFNGAIGANTANSGAFTTLTSSGVATISGNLVAASGTTSTDTTSGALVVTGGVGVSGTLNSRGIRQYSTTANSYIGFNGGFSTEGASGSNFLYIQALSNNINSGVGLLSLNATYNQMYSSGAIGFVTGATLRSQNTPTGGVQYVWIDAGGNLIANSTTASTSTTTGALQVQGGAGITGNIYLGSNVFAGTLSYSDVNIKFMGQQNYNGYVQSILQNTNNGTAASSDFIVNNDQSTATTYYGDFGMNSSGFSGSGSLNAPNNVYLTSTSSDLVLGTTTNNAIRFVVNNGANDAAFIAANGVIYVQTTTTSTNTATGALVISGGLGVVGNINAGSIQNTPIGNGTASTGAFTTLSATTLTTSGNITAQTANVYAAYTVANTGAVATNFFYSNGVSIASTISAIQYSNTQVGAYLTVYNGNIKAAYITAVQVGNSGTLLTGTLTTASQPNITSVGTLGSLTVTNTITGSVSGNAGSATQLQTARTINGVSFNGTSDITVTADAGTLTGSTLSSGVTASSLTSVGFLDNLSVNGNINTCNSVITNSVTAGVYTQNISTYDGTGNLNVYIPRNANLTVNAAQVAANLVVHGNGAASYQNLLVTNGSTGQVGIKIAPNAITTGASFQVNSTDAMIIPAGTTANRPTGAAGMIRYNTNSNNFEYWNVGSSTWATAQGAYTTITADSFTGNGSQVDFTMSQSSTTAAVVVSINGVIQIPTTAYSVSGTTLSFTEAPLSTDIIDARIITSTTTVTSIAFGTTSINISDTGAGTGNASTIVNGTARYIANTSNYFSGGIAPMMNPVSLTQNTPTTIDSFDKATYRVAKYVIKVADTTTNRYAGAEAIVVHDGTTATASFYGLVNTGANALVSYTTTIVGNNVVLQANTWSTTAKATVFQTYMTIN